MKFKSDKEKINLGLQLPLMESFYTIQGEGFHKGTAAYFIRLGGCDVGCHWCDVKESWDPNSHPSTDIYEIFLKAKQKSNVIVVTGGEPLMYDMNPLTDLLIKNNMQTHIETSGVYPLTGIWDWICLSPKKTAKPKETYYNAANELKVIIYNQNDFKWAEEHAAKMHEGCELFLQPEWSKRDEMMPFIVDYVMTNPKWKVSLQTHKYMHIP